MRMICTDNDERTLPAWYTKWSIDLFIVAPRSGILLNSQRPLRRGGNYISHLTLINFTNATTGTELLNKILPFNVRQ